MASELFAALNVPKWPGLCFKCICHFFAILLCLLISLPLAAHASEEIRVFVDENGVTRISNIPDQKSLRIQAQRPDVRPLPEIGRGKYRSRLPLEQRPFHDHVLSASRLTGLDSALIHAVISVESGYDRFAVSHKGARGLMQLLPATGRRFGGGDLFDPADNIAAGARYLSHLMGLFNNDLELSLAAYNAGEGAVVRHGNRIPPYSETRRYVPLVLERYWHATGRTVGNSSY